MNPGIRLTLGLAAAGVITAVGAWGWTLVLRRRKKDPAELERLRRLAVNRRGRITAGKIVDLVEPENSTSRHVFYKYEVAGVTYEAAQDISSLSNIASPARWLAGQTASIKYDPKKPTNSIVACEEWCGLPAPGPETVLEERPRPVPEKVYEQS